MTRKGIEGLFAPLEGVDWQDVGEVAEHATPILRSFSEQPGIVRRLFQNMEAEPDMRALCERSPMMDKFVLFRDLKDRFRLRLHFFRAGYFDMPHNHRWSYASVILRGGYKHVLYGNEVALEEEMALEALEPRMVRYEDEGASYVLHNSWTHAIQARNETVSMIIRGPAVSESFVVVDRVRGKVSRRFGASLESAEQQRVKRMAPEVFGERFEQLEQLGIL